ncbi:hypothetical protein N8909_01290 [bacterium]|nr:hypothetical protein [bacterium]
MANQNLNITIRAFDKTKKALSSASAGVRKVGGAVLSAKTAIVGLVGAAGFGALIKQGLAAGDSLAKTADKIGVTTEALAGMRHAAELTGVSTETMDMALQRFTRRASEAAIGTGEAKGALQELGINAKELVKLPLDKQMEVVADAMGGLGTQADRVRIAMKLFDSEGVALVNTLGSGSEALREMIAEADLLGLALSRTDTAQIEAANDAFTRAKGVITGLFNQISLDLAPVLKVLADGFTNSAIEANKLGNVGEQLADSLIGSFAHARAALHAFNIVLKKMELGFVKIGMYVALSLMPIMQGFIDIYNSVAGLLGKETIKTNFLADFANESKLSLQELRAELKGMSDLSPDEMAANMIEYFRQIREHSRATADGIAADKLAESEASKNADADKTSWQIYQDDLGKQSSQQRTEFEAKNIGDKTKHTLTELQKLTAGSAKQSKKLFAVQKAASIANALVQTYEAANIAFKMGGGFPAGIPMAALTIANGMAQVSAIKAQSFDGGGFTGGGSRSGGLDGKGGFPAILHPNETVIDHTKGQGASVVVNQVINVSTGVQDTVRSEIKNLMPQIAEASKVAVAQETRRGGSYSQMIQGR